MDRYGIRQVADVVLDGTRARGVRLLDGTVIEAGWVVLSAGTYGTPPPILLRSGIGPAEHLRSVGVPVRVDLPGVGASLADHAGVDSTAAIGRRRGPRRSCTWSPPSTARPAPAARPRTCCCGCPTLAARPAGRRSSRSTSCCSSLAPEARFGCAPWTQPSRR